MRGFDIIPVAGCADVAQLVEQPIRNQQVRGSSPLIGSTYRGVAQFGSAFGSGPKGRGFESRHFDHQNPVGSTPAGFCFCQNKELLSFYLK